MKTLDDDSQLLRALGQDPSGIMTPRPKSTMIHILLALRCRHAFAIDHPVQAEVAPIVNAIHTATHGALRWSARGVATTALTL